MDIERRGDDKKEVSSPTRGTVALDHFAADPVAAAILDAVSTQLLGWKGVSRRDTRSQVGFARRHPFAALWVPEQYLHRRTVPAVLSIMARHRIVSPRFKEVVEPRPGRFTHHLELATPGEVDSEVVDWLRSAWEDAA